MIVERKTYNILYCWIWNFRSWWSFKDFRRLISSLENTKWKRSFCFLMVRLLRLQFIRFSLTHALKRWGNFHWYELRSLKISYINCFKRFMLSIWNSTEHEEIPDSTSYVGKRNVLCHNLWCNKCSIVYFHTVNHWINTVRNVTSSRFWSCLDKNSKKIDVSPVFVIGFFRRGREHWNVMFDSRNYGMTWWSR